MEVFGIQVDVVKLVHSLVYIAFVIIVYLIFRRILSAVFSRAQGRKQEKRLQTIRQMLLSVAKYMMIILILLAVLANLGVNVTSLLAGLGIMTAVLGLAFQDLLKDVIAGITFLLEDQFRVGDQVSVDGFKGTVISTGLKTTQIQGNTGEVKIVANHNIENLVNYSKYNVLAQVEVSVPAEISPDEVLRVLKIVKREVKIPELSGEMQIGPVTEIEDAEVKYLLSMPCATGDSSTVQGAVMQKIVEVFDREKIPLAVPRVEIEK